MSLEDFYHVFAPNQILDQFFEQYVHAFIHQDNGDILLKAYDLGIEIPHHILLTMLYSKIIQSSIDIKKDHLHASWALSVKESPYPIDTIYLCSANKKIPLEQQKSTTWHWDSRHPVGFEVLLKNGESITLVKNDIWGILHLLQPFKHNGTQHQLCDKNHHWQFSIEAKPQYPVDLLSEDLLHNFPLQRW